MTKLQTLIIVLVVADMTCTVNSQLRILLTKSCLSDCKLRCIGDCISSSAFAFALPPCTSYLVDIQMCIIYTCIFNSPLSIHPYIHPSFHPSIHGLTTSLDWCKLRATSPTTSRHQLSSGYHGNKFRMMSLLAGRSLDLLLSSLHQY